MKPGILVAFLWEGLVEFGILTAIINKETVDGDQRQFIVSAVDADRKAMSDMTITDEDDLADMTSWNKDDALLSLAMRTEQWKWARDKSEELLNPPEPVRHEGDAGPAPVPAAPLVIPAAETKPKEIPF